MRIVHVVLILLFGLSQSHAVSAAEKPIFGPKKYDVKERFGQENLYSETFRVGKAGRYVLKVLNGTLPSERPDFVKLDVNGERVLKEDPYTHPVIACFVTLRQQAALALMVRDAKPTGMRRPAPTPRSVSLSVLPAPYPEFEGAFGVASWKDLLAMLERIRKIKNTQARSLAEAGVDLRNERALRVESLEKLSALQERSAQDLLLWIYGDVFEHPDVRAGAAHALGVLGDKAIIPVLMQEIVNSNDAIRSATALALSRYPEEETGKPLAAVLSSLDSMRMSALVRSLMAAGWKPVGVVIQLAESSDPYVANMAVEILGGLQDPRATDQLFAFLEHPGHRDMRSVVSALGQTRDRRAIDPLLLLAADPKRRAGIEADLGEALAVLGDQRAEDAIVVMIKRSPSEIVKMRLQSSYRKLMGKEYR